MMHHILRLVVQHLKGIFDQKQHLLLISFYCNEHLISSKCEWLMHLNNYHGSWHLLVHLYYNYMQITCLQWGEKFVIICRLNWKSRLNTTFMFAVINIGILQLKFTYVCLPSWHALFMTFEMRNLLNTISIIKTYFVW